MSKGVFLFDFNCIIHHKVRENYFCVCVCPLSGLPASQSTICENNERSQAKFLGTVMWKWGFCTVKCENICHILHA